MIGRVVGQWKLFIVCSVSDCGLTWQRIYRLKSSITELAQGSISKPKRACQFMIKTCLSVVCRIIFQSKLNEQKKIKIYPVHIMFLKISLTDLKSKFNLQLKQCRSVHSVLYSGKLCAPGSLQNRPKRHKHVAKKILSEFSRSDLDKIQSTDPMHNHHKCHIFHIGATG